MKSTGIISRLTSVNCDYTQPRMPSSSPLYTNIQFKTQNCDSVVLCGCDVIKGKSWTKGVRWECAEDYERRRNWEEG
jgi:hypothetical protein